MKILILSDEVWNDQTNGNNLLSAWFDGFNAEFANIYLSPGQPKNNVCSRYFQITDTMMLKSIISKNRAGVEFQTRSKQFLSEPKHTSYEEVNEGLYRTFKMISGEYLRVAREILWNIGRIDLVKLEKFVHEFDPDVIFTERMATNKILRIERLLFSFCTCPVLAFTGDDEYSLKQLSFSPLFWINRFIVRRRLRTNVKRYNIYYTLSPEQKSLYNNTFGCNTKLLFKCGVLSSEFKTKVASEPIVIVYAGKLYSKRWKSLIDLVDCIRKINIDRVKVILRIYTKDHISKRINKNLNDRVNSFIEGSVSQERLRLMYQSADIALHVESLSLKYRLLTRFSFSTKIVDTLLSGCAVLVYSWDKHSGFTYLRDEDAALTVSSKEQLMIMLNRIVENPGIISDYSKKARQCSARNHTREVVQSMLMRDFSEAIEKNRFKGVELK